MCIKRIAESLLLWKILCFSVTGAELSQSIQFRIDEESPIHTTIGNVSAYLPKNPKITTESPFFIVTHAGMVQLARPLDLESLCLEQKLCCERDKQCELVAPIVIEGDHASEFAVLELRVQVNDINDNEPRFDSRTGAVQVVKIPETTKVGSLISLLPAADADITHSNQVQRYVLNGNELLKYFELDSSEPPNIRLRLVQPLDYEAVKNYSGIIEACDRHFCTHQNLSVIVLDANDNKPAFLRRSYEVTIPENFSVGQSVLTLQAVDRDSPVNAHMDFKFQEGTDPDLRNTFRLDSKTGQIILQSRLAAHSRSEYRFAVRVSETQPSDRSGYSDGSILTQSEPVLSSTNTADVFIQIEDLNDFSPTIKLISPPEGSPLVVAENASPTRVCVLRVSDKDFDENGRVKCHLLPGPHASAFVLSGAGTHYTLSTKRLFDAEREPQLTASIACTDFGSPPKTSSRDFIIQVEDVNEYPPVLEKSTYHAAVYENTVGDTEVVQIKATDRDHNSKLHYELSGEGKQFFKINALTGLITTLGPEASTDVESKPQFSSVLDREKTVRSTFVVCISDGPPTTGCGVLLDKPMTPRGSTVFTGTATVIVTILDVNDNRPEFVSQGPFTIRENQPRYTEVTGRLIALDPDEGDNGLVRYSLRQTLISSSGIPAPDIFQVDADGHIRAMESLDRESVDSYTVEFMACDSDAQKPQCSSINTTITVLDENDNKPVWQYPHDSDKEVNITTDAAPGEVVARVQAQDIDAGPNGLIVYSLIDPHMETAFKIDNISGKIMVSRSNLVERSLQSGQEPIEDFTEVDSDLSKVLLPGVYRLRLRASDQGHPVHATEAWLQINVKGSELLAGAGLNFMIIVVMITVTGLISIGLVVAIICVRRRSSSVTRWNRRHISSNGRILADGVDGGGRLPLKHDCGFPLDGTGYMYGMSTTPSDLETMKLGYTPNGLSLIGSANGSSTTHLLGWSSIGHAPIGMCYPVNGEPLNICSGPMVSPMHSADANGCVQGTTLRMPVYTSFNRTSSVSGSDKDCANQPKPEQQQTHALMGASSSCLSFAAPSPPLLPSSSVLPANTLQSFGEVQTDLASQAGPMNVYNQGGTTLRHGFGCESNNTVPVHHNYTPFSMGTGIPTGCCQTSTRRSVLPHGELDVDSADSGRGPSEDDPSSQLFSGAGQVLHVYPAFHLTHPLQLDAAPDGLCTGIPNSLNFDDHGCGKLVAVNGDANSMGWNISSAAEHLRL